MNVPKENKATETQIKIAADRFFLSYYFFILAQEIKYTLVYLKYRNLDKHNIFINLILTYILTHAPLQCTNTIMVHTFALYRVLLFLSKT